jgi:hypothetical protein
MAWAGYVAPSEQSAIIANEERGVFTSNERCEAKSDKTLPQVALLLQ